MDKSRGFSAKDLGNSCMPFDKRVNLTRTEKVEEYFNYLEDTGPKELSEVALEFDDVFKKISFSTSDKTFSVEFMDRDSLDFACNTLEIDTPA